MATSNNDLVKSLFNDSLLKALIAKRKMPESNILALLEYASDVSENYHDAYKRVTSILDQGTVNGAGNSVQDYINEDVKRRLDILERQIAEARKPSEKKLVDTWQIIQAIMTVLAFSGSVLSLYKLFKP